MIYMGRFRDLFQSVKNWISCRIENIKIALSKNAPYSGTSVAEIIDVEKELNDFKQTLSPKLIECENICIQQATALFDEIIQTLSHDFPGLTYRTKKLRNEAIIHLKGSTNDYISQYVSENNLDLLNILKMQPGEEKKKQIGSYLDASVDNASAAFHKKLQYEITVLNDEISSSFQNVLSSQSYIIDTEKDTLQKLSRDHKQNTHTAEQHIAEAEPILEASDYIIELLTDLGGAT